MEVARYLADRHGGSALPRRRHSRELPCLREKDGFGGVRPGILLVLCEHPRCVTLVAAILVMTNDAAIYQKRIHKRTGIDDGRDSGGDGDGDGGGDEDEDDDGADHDGNDDGDEARGEREPSGGSDNFILFHVPSDRIRGRLNQQYSFSAM